MKKTTITCLLLFISSLCYASDPLDYNQRESHISRNEIFLSGGTYLGDSLSHFFVGGFDYALHINRAIALGTSFAYSKAKYQDNVNLNQPGFFTNDNIYIIDATLMLPMPMAFKAGKTTVEAELFGIFGVGTVHMNTSWKPQGFIGGGVKIFLFKPWFAIRVDMRTSMYALDKADGSSKFSTDVLMMVGASFQIPPQI